MPAIVQTNVFLSVGATDYTGISNRLEFNYALDLLDATTFGSGVVHRTRLPGLFDVGINFSGFWDSDKDLAAHGLIGIDNSFMAISSNNVRGSASYLTLLEVAELSRGAAVGEVFPFGITGQGNDYVRRGISLIASPSTHSGSSAGTPTLYIAPLTGYTTYLDIVVFDISGGGTLDITVERDDAEAFTTPTQIFGPSSVPITQIVAPGVYRYNTQVDHTDDWYRMGRTVFGNATYAVFLSISEF